MSDGALWGLIGSFIGGLVTLLGIYIAQSNGFLLYWIAKKEHDLNLRKATPVLGSIVQMETRQVLPAAYRPFHYVVTTIHNNGDLPARNVQGEWRMYSPNNAIVELRVPIRRDVLGPEYREEQQLVGSNIDEAVEHRRPIGINVDIDFDYTGISEGGTQHYSARYEYDHKLKQMVQI